MYISAPVLAAKEAQLSDNPTSITEGSWLTAPTCS
jgi:hypothetical protein